MPYKRQIFILLAVLAGGMIVWLTYRFEPRVFKFDDGPYYSKEFEGQIEQLPLQSSVELKRIGNVTYVIESRLLNNEQDSVLVLKRSDGTIAWKKILLKPDGPLGTIALGRKRTHLTWYGGWKVAIKPARQEGGYLYIGPFGGFRFFYHSW